MKKILALLAAVLCGCQLYAQNFKYYPSSYPKILNGTDTLLNGFCGGFVHPMFNNIDLNFDGLQDLVVYDIHDQSAHTFLCMKKGSTRYLYAPQYEHLLPELHQFAFFVDYNKDGKPDIFTMSDPSYNTTGLMVYKNISSGKNIAFQEASKALSYKSRSGISEMAVNQTELPAIADIDEDGDIDILFFPAMNNQISYYRSRSMDDYGKPDSLKFNLMDACWGVFYEYGSTENFDSLGYECSNYNTSWPRKEHSGSTLLAIDMDDDGDMDLAIGDPAFNTMNFMTNGRIGFSSKVGKRDTVISYKKYFPDNHPIKLNYEPLGYLVDVDNDGTFDMVASPMDITTAMDRNFIWYYHNDGTNKKPNFSFRQDNFLEESNMDSGTYSAPAFFDYNNDGLADLVLRVEGNGAYGQAPSFLMLFKNVGTAKRATFKLEDADFLGLRSKAYRRLSPCFADVNGDGKTDLLLGQSTGTVIYYRNTGSGSANAFTFEAPLTVDNGGQQQDMQVGSNSVPAALDVDKDGKTDLLVGSSSGRLYYYRNITTGSTPLFTLMTDTFGGIGSVNVKNQAAPMVIDLDRNGHPDLLLGDNSGGLRIFADIDQQSGRFVTEQTPFYNFGSKQFENIKLGRGNFCNVYPAAAQLDGDTFPDIVIGNSRGGLLAYMSQDHGYDSVVVSVRPQHSMLEEASVYPNPASSQLYFTCRSPQDARQGNIRLLDLAGREVYTTPAHIGPGRNTMSLSLPPLQPGLYIFTVDAPGQGTIYTQKLLIR